jgi:predicted flap endonuclease-1-like 5' DNA nuclease
VNLCPACHSDSPTDATNCRACGTPLEASASTAAPTRGKLADDFPGAAALTGAGYGTYGKVRKIAAADELTAIPGIGAATAQKIKDALALDTDTSDEDAQQ